MAKILTIAKDEPFGLIAKKIREWAEATPPATKAFNAAKYTGKIKAYGNGLAYQRKLRHEWD